MSARVLVVVFVAISVAWHAWWVVAPPDPGGGPRDRVPGRDFATYYYAAAVAASRGDPWDTAALDARARADGHATGVHPWLYPPAALLVVAWAPALDLPAAAHAWTVIQEVALLLAGLVLAWWWRPLGPAVPAAVAGWIAFTWGVPYGLAMGQINPLILLLVVAGLALAERGRELEGGALLGLACVSKMAPAVWLIWWASRGRWRAIGSAIGAAVLAFAAALPLVGPAEQLRFFTEVLPGFSTGDYNGLVVKIGLFANHGLPNLVDQLLPGDGARLSPAGRAVSGGLALGLLIALGAAFRGRTDDPWQVAGQVAAVGAFALLVPVYTFEHHLTYAIPAGVALSCALIAGRLHPAWWGPIGFAMVALAWPHAHLRALAEAASPAVGWMLQEAKCAALVALLAGGVRLGTARGS